MKSMFHKFTAILLVIAVMIPFLAACGEEPVDLAAVYKLSDTTLDMKVGNASAILIYDETYSDRVYTAVWASDNPNVVNVYPDNGYIEAVGEGMATVTATLTFPEQNNETVVLSCLVNVTMDVVPVSGVSLSSMEETLDVGGVTVLSASVLPVEATNKTVTWSSGNPAVAIVTSGVVTAVGAGNAIITATTEDGAFSAYCSVTVNEPVDAFESLKLNKTSVSVNIGKTVSLVATVKPEGIPASIIWTSGDDSVATVENGTVTGVKAGTTTITATLNDKVTNKVATCKVTVNKPESSSTGGSSSGSSSGSSEPKTVKATNVSFDKESITVYTGETGPWAFIPTVTPSNTTETGAWSSNNPSVASVDSTGMITVGNIGDKAFDTATITYKVGSVSASGVIVVMAASSTPSTPSTPSEPEQQPAEEPSAPDTTEKITDIILGDDSYELLVGNEYLLEFDAYPKSVTTETYKWTSSDDTVATVSANGLVKGISAGTVIITVTGEKSGIKAVCAVSVKDVYAESIALNESSVTLTTVGETKQLTATLSPAGAKDTVTWISDQPTVATVDQNGLVAAVSTGSAIISATTGSGKTAKCAVACVISGGTIPGIVPGTQFTTVKVGVYVSANGDLKAGETYQAYLTFEPQLSAAQLAECAFNISSSDSNVASVSRKNSGDYSSNAFYVTPNNDGTASLTGTVSAFSLPIKFDCSTPTTVTVNSPDSSMTTPITSLTLSPTASNLTIGDKITIIASATPYNNNDSVSWSSSNPAVAKVTSSGLTCTIEAVSKGTATITCKTKGKTKSISETCKVEVQATGTVDQKGRIYLSKDSTFAPAIEDFGLTGSLITITPLGASQTIAVAGNMFIVSKNAQFGDMLDVQILYRDSNNEYTTVTYTAIVFNEKPTSSATVNTVSYSGTVRIGEKDDLSKKYPGSYYESSDSSVIDIDDDGDWEAKKPGKATITVKDEDTNPILKINFTVDFETVTAKVAKGELYFIENLVNLPSNLTIDTVVSSSSSRAEVRKQSGKYSIDANSTGSATITITFSDGTKLYLDLTIVSSKADTLNMSYTKDDLTIDMVLSSGMKNVPVKWSIITGGDLTDNDLLYPATTTLLDSNGESKITITILSSTKTGSVTVKATVNDDSELTISKTISISH